MAKKATPASWKKGQSGNPGGRKPILLPEIQKDIDSNRNALKKLILSYFSLTEDQIAERQRDRGIPYLEKMLGQCFERTTNDGNVDSFRKLLEIVFGRLPEEKDPFETTAEEKLMIMTYRKKLEENEQRLISGGPTNDQGSDSKEE